MVVVLVAKLWRLVQAKCINTSLICFYLRRQYNVKFQQQLYCDIVQQIVSFKVPKQFVHCDAHGLQLFKRARQENKVIGNMRKVYRGQILLIYRLIPYLSEEQAKNIQFNFKLKTKTKLVSPRSSMFLLQGRVESENVMLDTNIETRYLERTFDKKIMSNKLQVYIRTMLSYK